MKRRFQSVSLALLLALLASPASALAMCATMQAHQECSQPATHCPACADESGASLRQQPAPMDDSCCAMAPARPAPRTDVQGPTFAAAEVPAVRSLTTAVPVLPHPPLQRREALLLQPAESPQAVLCTFLI